MDAQKPQAQQAPNRLPLFATPSNRRDDPASDARLINGYAEQTKDGELYVYKRAGTVVYASFSGNGRGIFNWNGNIYSIFGTTLYKDGVSKGTVDGTNGVYTFSACLGTTPKLFFQNGVHAYTYDDGGGLVEESYTQTITTTGDTHSTTVITNIPSTTGLNAFTSVVGAGIPAGAYIVTVDSATQVTINTAATATAAGVSLTFQTQGAQTATVKGQAYLDGTTYVMTAGARIYGSELNDPTKWDALNYLTAQIEPDGGVFLAKQLAYVVAFKQWSTEFFYDAGNPVGSPLGTVQGAKLNHGCRFAGSVQDVAGTLVWVSDTREGSVGVQRLEGLKVQPVGTPPVERLLQDASSPTVWSWSFKLGGHRFYGVTLKEDNRTLVYDLTTNLWYQWTDTNGNYMPFVSATYTSGQEVLMQHETDGKIYKLDINTFTDNGAGIPWELYTPNFDGGTRKVKYLHRLDFIADQTPGSVLEMRSNDSDFATGEWTNFRRIDLAVKRPNVKNLGSFRRRTFHFRHLCDAPLRLQAVEMQVEVGDL
jgi:hypothetical protein